MGAGHAMKITYTIIGKDCRRECPYCLNFGPFGRRWCSEESAKRLCPREFPGWRNAPTMLPPEESDFEWQEMAKAAGVELTNEFYWPVKPSPQPEVDLRAILDEFCL
jgi:hypothetical protein